MPFSFPFFTKKKSLAGDIPDPRQIFEENTISSVDLIAPSSIIVKSDQILIGKRIIKSFFIFSYPRYLGSVWLSSAVNLGIPIDISLFIHPLNTGNILKRLRRKVTEVQSELMEKEEKGLIRDPELETAFQDLEGLRDRIQTAQERMFRFGLYITVYADSLKEMREIEVQLRSLFESRLVYIKPALYQQKEGFQSCLPIGKDMLGIHTPMNTEPLSSAFPFVSSDLSSNEGVLYGINMHNNSLILFDRFSMENANSVIFAKSGSGKSYAVKLEVLRYLMMGVDALILDPENEYKMLAEATGGSFVDLSLGSENHLNPFDLPLPNQDEQPSDVLRSNIINLVGLLRIMLGGLSPEEDSIVDKALSETYAAKDITPDSDPKTWKDKTPIMQDLQTVLEGMEGTESLVQRLIKYTTGTYANFFNTPTNISLDKKLVVFGIREMQEGLRPMAVYIVMRHVWNKVKSDLRKRIFIIDEAWWVMQNEEGASFLFGLAKRARKYWLGVTTITQDVSDFMKSEYGGAIINNSSIQFLMKQSPASIELVQKTFNLTSGERSLLLEGAVGEGVFFAGEKHVAAKVIASPTEHEFITTNPEELAKQKQDRAQAQAQIQSKPRRPSQQQEPESFSTNLPQ